MMVVGVPWLSVPNAKQILMTMATLMVPYVRTDTPGERVIHRDNERFSHLAHLKMKRIC